MSVIAGSPTGREPYGDGAPVVVRAKENLVHGEGGQEVRSRIYGEVREMRDAKTILGIIRARGRQGLPLEDVYRQLYTPEL